MSDSTFRDNENKTASIAMESLSYHRQLETTSNLQLQQQSGNSLARDLDPDESTSKGSGEEKISLENMLVKCPDVPSNPCNEPKNGDTGELASTGSGQENISLENLLALCPDVPSNPCNEPKDGDTSELASTGSGHENISLENLLALCPDVPSNPCNEPKDGDTSELASTGSGQENISLENLLALCPDVPSIPRNEQNDGATSTTAKVTSTSCVPCAASGGPRLWEDADQGNSALSNVSSKCSPGEVKLFWPLEVSHVTIK